MVIIPYLLAFVVGLLAGWLTNVVAVRFPNAERPLLGPFHCVRCNHALTVRNSLPVLGYLLQKGRCRYCERPIPWSFPAIELTLGLAFAFAWPMYEHQPLYVYLVNLFYIFLLMTIGLIDWRHRLIFPVMTWAGCLVAIVVALFFGSQPDFLLPDGLGSVLIGAAVGGGLFYFIYIVAYGIYKRRALGFGDVLLAILIGAMVGFPRVVSALFLGAVLGGVTAVGYFLIGGKRWRDFIPYGTTLCLGVMLILIWGPAVWNWGPFGLLTWFLRVIFGWVGQQVFGMQPQV